MKSYELLLKLLLVITSDILVVGQEEDGTDVRQWVSTVGEVQDVLTKSSLLPPSIVPVPSLLKLAERLRRYWLRAAAEGHILTWTLRDHLEELVAFAHSHAESSMLPNKWLEGENMRRFANVVEQRERRGILIDPRMRQVLRKLLILRLWIGNRNIRKLDVDFLDERFEIQEPSSVDMASLHYVVNFRGGPLYVDIGPGPAGEPQIRGFKISDTGKIGPAEECGIIEVGHTIVAVNGEKLQGLPYQAAIEKLVKASWPKALVFCKSHIENENGRRQATQLEREQSAKAFFK
eukprot:g22.t1